MERHKKKPRDKFAGLAFMVIIVYGGSAGYQWENNLLSVLGD
jgi:hypothetical protein